MGFLIMLQFHWNNQAPVATWTGSEPLSMQVLDRAAINLLQNRAAARQAGCYAYGDHDDDCSKQLRALSKLALDHGLVDLEWPSFVEKRAKQHIAPIDFEQHWYALWESDGDSAPAIGQCGAFVLDQAYQGRTYRYRVSYMPQFITDNHDHITFVHVDSEGYDSDEPCPMTDTGFTSAWLLIDQVDQAGSIDAIARAWLDAHSKPLTAAQLQLQLALC